ncbi:hypothetical protein F5Y01DRAFT_275614 [Xylaria sp. FL0043]|nr:hypothetical protein F5Y01DRAFT_275614 [Xylaria sp. FL0043]
MCHGSVFPRAWLKQSPRLVCRRLVPQSTTRRLNYARQTGSVRTMASSSSSSYSSSSSGQESPLEKRVVVGSFIFKIPDGDRAQAKVALFRRSGMVKTYKHKLSPCSGRVELYDKSPLAAALREIREETNLPASSLELLCAGKPYSFTDESVNHEWSIHPLAFRLKDIAEGGVGERGISLDWENEAIEWFDPMQVNGSPEFGGVPRLVESLRRVWPEYDLGPEAGRALVQGINRIRWDRQHGAISLADLAVVTLQEVIRLLFRRSVVDEDWWVKIRMAAWHICQSRSDTDAAITIAMFTALGAIEHHEPFASEVSDVPPPMVRALDHVLTQREQQTNFISGTFHNYIRGFILSKGVQCQKPSISVLTLSLSYTVLRCLSHLSVGLDLRILESRPLFEGVTTASEILRRHPTNSNIRVTLYTDASAALAARDIDFLILGADRISSAGDVSNATGSLPAVLSARHVAPDVKVLVLSDVEKISRPIPMDVYIPKQNSPREISKAWTVDGAEDIGDALNSRDPRIAVKHDLSEWVPGSLIDLYINNRGIWDLEMVQTFSGLVGEKYEQVFKEL